MTLGEATASFHPLTAGGELDWPLIAIRWIGATMAGLAYAWLYIRSDKLWSSVIAHAVTHGALGVWVVCLRQGQFW
jgi:membrane protease YdiL (CAAX protease family)